jgi:hypothetical protein
VNNWLPAQHHPASATDWPLGQTGRPASTVAASTSSAEQHACWSIGSLIGCLVEQLNVICLLKNDFPGCIKVVNIGWALYVVGPTHFQHWMHGARTHPTPHQDQRLWSPESKTEMSPTKRSKLKCYTKSVADVKKEREGL